MRALPTATSAPDYSTAGGLGTPAALSQAEDPYRSHPEGRPHTKQHAAARFAYAIFRLVADSLPVRRSAWTSYETFMPSARPLKPERSTALMCTNTSLPP